MYDPPSGMQAKVERLLQVLAVLRAADLPVQLDDAQDAVLGWLLGAGTAADPGLPQPPEVALLGSLPSALDLAHAALAGRRRLVVRRQGQEKVVEPVQLHVRHGHWYLLVRYGRDSGAYGYRLDRLDVVRLGDPMSTLPEPVDRQEVLDATAWRKHEPVDVELRCRFEDTAAVAWWFPRAVVREHPSATRLTFVSSNLDAVVDRVIGLAGAARIVAPPAAVDLLRTRVTAVLGVSA